MNKQQVGQAVFNQIKEYLSEHGLSMAKNNFPADFPLSRRTCYYIRAGKWTPELLEKLPFKVTVEYKINFT